MLIFFKKLRLFQNNKGGYQSMKTTKFYLNERELFVQEAVYQIFPELKLRRVFQAVHFVNTNFLGERVKKDLKSYPMIDQISLRNEILIDTKINQINHFLVESICFR